MQPLVLLAIAGIAGMTMSMGFLMPAIPDFNLQGVSVNERDFSYPITTANVDIDISKSIHFDQTAQHTVFWNLISECSFHTPSSGLGDGSTVICKLTDDQGDVVAEGRQDFPDGLAPSERTIIDIVQTAFPGANEIQRINDIKIIVLGTDVTCGGPNQPACT